ncbi:hypothetical protein KVR01_006801 [Diaporthe batatas]|uniref:uncharacterized protein n=1 Tax=Diaporthe batatas TaxID=748121 RepID=UPI001D0428FD|nr:uncharacterized protein KVR01_006801 [Diaporthe batatas]KAG8163504.1 hypothetical protein KVR01_006801 [Diaporthe batatas]
MWDYGDDNRGPEMAVVALVMTSLSVIAVALRCYTMITILKRFLVEDWLALLTCLLQCAFCTFVLLGVSHGLGAHVEHVPEDQRPKALVFKWAGQIAYIVVSTLVKFVVGIFLLRLCVNNGWQRITIWVLLVLVGLFNIFYVFVAVFQCQPVSFYWWRYAENAPITGKCNGRAIATVPTYIAVLLGIAGDLILALLPITLIKHAKLDKKTKISVICVLSLGSLASVATIARIPYAQQVLSNPDYLYNFSDLAIWSIVECGIAITASSLATLRPLFVKMKLLATNHFTSRFTSSNGGLPMFTNKTHTFVSASKSQKQGINRNSATTRNGTGILRSVSESKDGIQVKREFEMSVITHSSKDSIDQLENEVDEVISPGTAKSGSIHSRGHSYQQSLRLNPSPRLSPAPSSSRPTLQDAPILMPPAAITSPIGPPTSHATNGYSTYTGWQASASPQSSRSASAARKGSFGQVSTPFGGISVDQPSLELRSPPPISNEGPRYSHHSTKSQDSSRSTRTPRSTATSFHLPTRMQHYSVASSASCHSSSSTSSKANSRGTFGADGLSLPSRITESGYGNHTPDINNHPSSVLHQSPIIQVPNSSQDTRFPFEKPNTVAGSKKTKKRRTRVSAFLADNSSASSAENGDCSDEELTGTRPQWAGQGREALPSPLTSHPPLSPRENWV